MEAEVAIVKQVASLRNSLIDGIKERADTGDGYCSHVVREVIIKAFDEL